MIHPASAGYIFILSKGSQLWCPISLKRTDLTYLILTTPYPSCSSPNHLICGDMGRCWSRVTWYRHCGDWYHVPSDATSAFWRHQTVDRLRTPVAPDEMVPYLSWSGPAAIVGGSTSRKELPCLNLPRPYRPVAAGFSNGLPVWSSQPLFLSCC